MTKEEKEALKNIKKKLYRKPDYNTGVWIPQNYLEILLNLIKKQQAEIEKKDKMIDLMAEEIIKNLCHSTIEPNYELPYLDEKIRKTFENIKQYFEKRVESEANNAK